MLQINLCSPGTHTTNIYFIILHNKLPSYLYPQGTLNKKERFPLKEIFLFALSNYQLDPPPPPEPPPENPPPEYESLLEFVLFVTGGVVTSYIEDIDLVIDVIIR